MSVIKLGLYVPIFNAIAEPNSSSEGERGNVIAPISALSAIAFDGYLKVSF